MSNKMIRGATLAVAVLGAGAVSAADLPARKGPVMAPAFAPVFSWTGFYAGLNAGYSFNRNSAVTVGTAGFIALAPAVPGSLRTGKDGFTGGAQIGYNYQVGAAVMGLETDLQYIDGKRGSAFTSAALGGLTTAASTDMSYLGTLRARLGFVAADRLMIYVTGGLAYGNPDNTASVVAVGPGALWGGSKDDVRFGYAVGAGMEYALTNNWSAKL
jgi:outer membrane immunogenic protein